MTRPLAWRVRFWLYETRSAAVDWAWRQRSRLAEWRERGREWRESARWRAGEPVSITPPALALGAIVCVALGLGLGALIWPRAAPVASVTTPSASAGVYNPVDRPAVIRAITPTPALQPIQGSRPQPRR